MAFGNPLQNHMLKMLHEQISYHWRKGGTQRHTILLFVIFHFIQKDVKTK